jgi:hypothetical protein
LWPFPTNFQESGSNGAFSAKLKISVSNDASFSASASEETEYEARVKVQLRKAEPLVYFNNCTYLNNRLI